MMKPIVSRLTLITCFVFISTAMFAQVTIQGEEIQPGSMQAGLEKKFKSFRLFTIPDIDLPSLETTAIRLSLGNDNVNLSGAHSPLTDRNSRIVALAAGGNRYLPYPELLFLNGANNRITVGNNFLAGEFEMNGEKHIIENVSVFNETAGDNVYIVYRTSDIIDADVSCGTESSSQQQEDSTTRPRSNLRTFGICRTIDIAVFANSTSFKFHSSSLDITASYIASIYNLSDGDYLGAFDDELKFKINELVVSTSAETDPWFHTDDINLNLSSFNGWAPTGFKSENDLTSYWFRTTPFSSGTVGLAYRPSTCFQRGDVAIREYGAGLQTMRVLLSHEHGHSLNSGHDASGAPFIMAPAVNSSNTLFSPESKIAINAHLLSPSTSCISACTYAPCERTIPTGLKIVYDSTTNMIKSTWTNDPTLNGYRIRVWDMINGTAPTLTDVSPTAASFQFTPPGVCDTTKKFRVEVAKVCTNGQTGTFEGTDLEIFATTGGTASGTATVCSGTNSGVITLLGNRGTILRWQFSTDNGTTWQDIANTTSTLSYSGLTTSRIYRAVTQRTGCEIKYSTHAPVTVVTKPPVPSITVTGPTTICEGAVTTLTSSAATGNRWMLNGQWLADTSRTLNPSVSGNYSVAAYAGVTCFTTSASAISITVQPAPGKSMMNAIVTDNFLANYGGCEGVPHLFTSTSATGNQWYRNGVAIAGATTQSYSTSVVGSYTVQVNATGCPWLHSDPYTLITAPEPPSITSASTVLCSGATVTLTSSALSNNQWYRNNTLIPGASGRDFVANQPGAYAVRMLGSTCPSSLLNAVTITANTPLTAPNVSPGSSANICEGSTLTLTSSAQSANQWMRDGVAIPGATSPVLLASMSGAYSVRISDVCTTVNSASVTVTVNPNPLVPTITQVGSYLQSSASSGNQWYLNGVAIAGATDQRIYPTATGDYSVTVTVNGCNNSSANFRLDNVPTSSASLIVAPNPVRDVLTISFRNNNDNKVVRLVDITGKKVLAEGNFTSTHKINMMPFASGVYVVQVTNQRTGEVVYVKVLKQ